MCACNATLTCSLACAMGFLHDETNTRLSIEQPMDLKPRKDVINLSMHNVFLSHINPQGFSVTWQFPVSKRWGRCQGGRARLDLGCRTEELVCPHDPPSSGYTDTETHTETDTQINEPKTLQITNEHYKIHNNNNRAQLMHKISFTLESGKAFSGSMKDNENTHNFLQFKWWNLTQIELALNT